MPENSIGWCSGAGAELGEADCSVGAWHFVFPAVVYEVAHVLPTPCALSAHFQESVVSRPQLSAESVSGWTHSIKDDLVTYTYMHYIHDLLITYDTLVGQVPYIYIIYVYLCIYYVTYLHKHIHTCVYIYIAYIHTQTHTHIYIYTYVYAKIHIHTH